MIIKIYVQNNKTGKWYLNRIVYSNVFEVNPEYKSIFCDHTSYRYKKIKFYRLFNVVKVWEEQHWCVGGR